jgi:guanine nucleotide-binding protein subunit alpha
MVEDPETNRMIDAIQVFDHIINHPALQKPNVVLFLNKKDLFTKKVKESPIKKYFPDYTGIES